MTVLFDFDGVLVRGDSFSLFVQRRVLASWRLALMVAALPVIVPLAMIRPLRPRAARLIIRIVVFGVPSTEFRRRATEFARVLVGEPGRILQSGVSAVHRHLAAGDRVVVVTACEQTLARSILDNLGLSQVELVGSRFDGRDGVVHNHGAEKLRQLAAYGIEAPWKAAYSDSLWDLPLLCGSEHPILVNAGPRTTARARSLLGDRLATVTW